MKKNLIIIGAGMLQLPLINTARKMGLRCLIFDMSRDAPGMLEADEQVVMSTRDIDGCVREAKSLARRMHIHGVITAGTDASRAVAAIAGALNLPGIRYADAEAASNKVLMRRRLFEAGLPIPDFRSVWSLKEARDAMDEMQFPLVLKPADNMGARGVVKLNSREDMQASFRHAKKFSPTGEMILEEFMHGPELSLDALAWNGKKRLTGIADRIIEKEPFFVELGHTMPSEQPQAVQKEAERVMFAAMDALGIHTGAAKGDLKCTSKGVMIGEIAARLSGGFMSSHTYPLHSGVNLLRAAIQIALGDEPEALDHVWNRVAIERGIIGEPGKIIALSGKEPMREIRGIEEVVFTRNVGDILQPPNSNLDKAGHIIAVADSREEAEAIVAEAMTHLNLKTDAAAGVDWKGVEEKARNLFGDSICWVCKICDGTNCASGVPGMGGVGSMNSFRDNSLALVEAKIVPRYIRENVVSDTSWEFLGYRFEMPIMSAPMTGLMTNMNGALDEYEFARLLLLGARESGSLAWLGDGASPEKYKEIIRALAEAEGFGILICKPRKEEEDLRKRFQAAEDARAIAVGMDIDAVSFKTMRTRRQKTITRNVDELRHIREMTSLPFIVKGIMSPEDAQHALEAGVDAIVVSNHGGRVLDDMPGTARVLGEISRVIAKRIPVLVDGGVRSGRDVFKMLGIGAEAVLVGRPMAIAAVGGRIPAVQRLLGEYKEEFRVAMNLCGCENVSDITAEYLRHYGKGQESISFP